MTAGHGLLHRAIVHGSRSHVPVVKPCTIGRRWARGCGSGPL